MTWFFVPKFSSILCCFRPFPLISTIVVCILALFFSLPVLGAQVKESGADNNNPMIAGKGCVKLAALDILALQQDAPQLMQKKIRPPIPEKELLRPMTEKELRQMIRALEPVRSEKGKEWAIRAMVEGTELPFERLGVLLSDATALLVNLHTREALDRIRKIPDVDKGMLAWMENAFKAIDFCAQARFDGHGGLPAYKESIQLVEKFRKELGAVILNNLGPEILFRLEGKEGVGPGTLPHKGGRP